MQVQGGVVKIERFERRPRTGGASECGKWCLSSQSTVSSGLQAFDVLRFFALKRKCMRSDAFELCIAHCNLYVATSAVTTFLTYMGLRRSFLEPGPAFGLRDA
eukprot:4695684-Amphidinium_carterae.2